MKKLLCAVAAVAALTVVTPALADGEWCEGEPAIAVAGVPHHVVYRVYDPVGAHVRAFTVFRETNATLLPEQPGAFASDTQVLIPVSGENTAIISDSTGVSVSVDVFDNGVLVATGTTNHAIEFSLH